MNKELITPKSVTRNIRLPKTLLDAIIKQAGLERRSVNSWIVNTLEDAANQKG